MLARYKTMLLLWMPFLLCGCNGKKLVRGPFKDIVPEHCLREIAELVDNPRLPTACVFRGSHVKGDFLFRGNLNIICAIWDDGTIVWSDDRISGGSPYMRGKTDPAKIVEMKNDLDRKGVFGNPSLNLIHIPVSSSCATVIAIIHGSKQLCMMSCHEVVEGTSNNLVVTSRGIELLEEGKSRPQILAEQPGGYRQYREAWKQVRSALDSFVPVGGAKVLYGKGVDPAFLEKWNSGKK